MRATREARLAFGIATSAMAVTACRLVVAFLEADRVAIPREWRVGLLAVTAVATGVVVTGGVAYLAHAAARRSRYRGLLVSCVVLVLAAAAVLLTPLLVGALAGQHLSEVLTSTAWRWTWSSVAVLAPEVIAAGAMVAYAAAEREQQLTEQLEDELHQMATERNGMQHQLAEARQEIDELHAELVRADKQLDEQIREASELEKDLAELTSRADQVDELERELAELREHRASTAPSTDETVECRHGCGWTGMSTKAEAGHQRACPAREVAE